jgi:DNA-binding beta-propeller fold protein YncE
VLSIIDTRTNAFLASETETSGFINTNAKGDWGSGNRPCFLNTKYNEAVVLGNQGWTSSFDLNSRDCTGCVKLSYGYAPASYGVCYDPTRGYMYSAINGTDPMFIDVTDMNPANRVILGTHTAAAGHLSYGRVYCPVNDKVYLANPGGGSDTNLFHKWDPATYIFQHNLGPVGTGDKIWFIPGINLIMIRTAGGTYSGLVFIDPGNSDAVVGFCGIGFGTTVSPMVAYNPCGNKIYLGLTAGANDIQRIDPAAGFSNASIPGTGNAHDAYIFDPCGNKLYCVDNATDIITTV